MLNFISTFGVDNEFEKNRLLLTKANLQAPNEQQMKNILMTFSGQDQQTRAQIAYASIIRKIHSSTSKDNWLYILKNLLILDRVISDNRFCHQIVETQLLTVENFKDTDSKASQIGASLLLKNYWALIKKISRNKISKSHILYYKRGQRKTFLEGLKSFQIFKEIKNLQILFNQCLELIYHVSGISNVQERQNERLTQVGVYNKSKFYKQFTNSHLAEYMTLHFYSKLLTFFSCQYLCIHQYIQTLISHTKNQQTIRLQDIKQFKKTVHKFKINCNDMVLLAERNKHQKGFQHIDIKQFYNFQEEGILKFIDEFIHQRNSTFEERPGNIQPLVFHRQENKQHLQVQIKPVSNTSGKFHKSPRKTIQIVKNKNEKSKQIDPFAMHYNGYSASFPHSDMMTLDLIQDLRSQPTLQQDQFTACLKTNKQEINKKDFFSDFKELKQKSTWSDILCVDKEFLKPKDKEEIKQVKHEPLQNIFNLLLSKKSI